MRAFEEIHATLERDGFAVADDLLPGPVFDDLDARVLASWRTGVNWNTRVKGPGRPRILPLATGTCLSQITELIDRVDDGGGDVFTYLYHQFHEGCDQRGLVRSIEEVVVTAWRETIEHLVGPFERTNFSLTAFSPGCRLARHTDHGGEGAYRLTMLLYFSGEGSCEIPLMFGNGVPPARIYPRPNRSVIFVPSAETTHWIDPVPFQEERTVRLAFSGWLI